MNPTLEPINNSGDCNIVNMKGPARNNGNDEITDEEGFHESNQPPDPETNSQSCGNNDTNNNNQEQQQQQRGSGKKKREAVAV